MFAAEVVYTDMQGEVTQQYVGDEERHFVWNDWADAAYAACEFAYMLHTPGTEATWRVVDTKNLSPMWRERLETP